MEPIIIYGNLMVLNEAPFLPVVIPAIQEVVDHLIVQDNGSTDNSVAIISNKLRRQDSLIQVQQGDPPNYAELHNSMLEYVPDGSWVLKWDADELPSDGMVYHLKTHMARYSDVIGWTVPCYHIMKEPRLCLPMEFGFGHLCLYKKTAKTRYVGAVHEQPIIEGDYGAISPFDTDIAIIHLSYFAEERLKKKSIRYSQIPGSGFTSPTELYDRLLWKPISLPEHITYNAPQNWLEKIRSVP